jgi:predicted nucleic acid-binding protein
MDIVIDTSALVSVIVGEPERAKIIKTTAGNTLLAPGSIPWEIGNAFSAMFKQKRLSLEEAKKGIFIFNSIPIRYIETDFISVLNISKQAGIYAYDAYFLDCAARQKAPLLTLDRRLKSSALDFNIKTVEV